MKTFHCVYDYHNIEHDRVTRDEFTEYYKFISASVDNDQYFELMMNNAWRMNEGANKNWNTKGWSNKDEQPTSSPSKP
jgi:lysine/ornithine N-monooxygenase